jgi:hypothetical protein
MALLLRWENTTFSKGEGVKDSSLAYVIETNLDPCMI